MSRAECVQVASNSLARCRTDSRTADGGGRRARSDGGEDRRSEGEEFD
jgi:hypothetical protein